MLYAVQLTQTRAIGPTKDIGAATLLTHFPREGFQRYHMGHDRNHDGMDYCVLLRQHARVRAHLRVLEERAGPRREPALYQCDPDVHGLGLYRCYNGCTDSRPTDSLR
jgi:hypothetical protein